MRRAAASASSIRSTSSGRFSVRWWQVSSCCPLLGSRASLIVGLGAGDRVERSCWPSRCATPTPPRAVTIAVVAPMLFLMAARIAVDPFDVAFERFHRSETLVWREEGAQTTVAIHERRGSPPMRVMYLDGNHQANDSPATAFVHHRIGALPAMLHPKPATALVVGLGGGATPGAVARLNVDGRCRRAVGRRRRGLRILQEHQLRSAVAAERAPAR